MKTEFRLRPPAKNPPRADAGRVRADSLYAPLSLPHILARRIEVRPMPRVELRPFRWKRDDESVN